jgi:hypothetical protein
MTAMATGAVEATPATEILEKEKEEGGEEEVH